MTRFLPFGSRSKTIQVNTLGGGAPAVTYATWNPADKGNITLSGGDLIAQSNAGTWNSVRSTISKTSGKWYCEITCGGSSGGGITLGSGTSSANLFDLVGMDANGWGIYWGWPNKFHNGSNVAFGSGGNLVAWDIIQISLDMDWGNIYIGKNGTDFWLMYSWLGSWPMFIMASVYNNGTTATANFGATPFAYSVPSGYNAGLYT